MEDKIKTVKCKVTITCEVYVCPDYYGGDINEAIHEALEDGFEDYMQNIAIEQVETFYETEEERCARQFGWA